MNIKEIRQLIKLMVDNELTELSIVDGQNTVTLKRGPEGVPVVTTAPAPATQAEAKAAEQGAEELLEVKSPMVGTFYAAASPDSEVYVQLGEVIGEEAVVCIIEAMKVMNEIKADCSGTVVEICVKDAQPVEFGQVLFRVRPA